MSKIKVEWCNWIKENKERQCNPLDIFTHLINEGYDPEECFHLVYKDTSYHSKNWLDYSQSQLIIESQKIDILLEYSNPEIKLFGNVLTNQECDRLIDLSKNRLKNSKVIQDNINIVHEARTSENAYYKSSENIEIANIEKRISDLLNYPREKIENLQVLKYKKNGQYKPHHDFFIKPAKNGGQRIGTFIIYLNDVVSGGETYFPNLGLNIKPKKGNALFFSYTNDQNEHDVRTLHGGQIVNQGEKWIATTWLRQSPIIK